MNRPAALLAALALLLLLPGRGEGTSQFSSNGMGIALRATHARGWAMGGLSVALPDSLRLSLANPAVPAGMRRVSVSGVYVGGRRTAKDGAEEVTFDTNNLPLVELLVPFGSRFAVGFGYTVDQDLTTVPTRIPFDEGEVGDVSYTRYLERHGTLFRVPALFALRFFRDVRFGARVDNYFFNLEEDFDLIFEDGGVDPTREKLLIGGSGVGATAGLLIPIRSVAHIGLVYSTSAQVDGELEREGASGTVFSKRVDVGIPERFGAGLTLGLPGRWTVGAEVTLSRWEDVADTLSAFGGYNDVVAVAAGLELGPRTGSSWYDRFPFRLGFRHDPLSYRAAGGEEIGHWLVSAGTGFPLRGGWGMVDLGVEYGEIGDVEAVGLEESYLRFVVGFAGQEPWRRRKSYID